MDGGFRTHKPENSSSHDHVTKTLGEFLTETLEEPAEGLSAQYRWAVLDEPNSFH